MDRKRKLGGLVRGAAAMAAFGATQLAAAPNPDEVLQAKSFTELLQPISDAPKLLAAVDASSLGGQAAKARKGAQVAQYHHHHHHHHHRDWGVEIVPPWARHHHHHHHHHHHYDYDNDE
jgi:hypothetical protein